MSEAARSWISNCHRDNLYNKFFFHIGDSFKQSFENLYSIIRTITLINHLFLILVD